MNDHDAVRRAQSVERLVGEKVYQEAWDSLRAALLAKMETSVTDEATLKAKQLLGLMGDLQGYFRQAMQDGRIAAESIKLEEQRKKSKIGLWR